MAKDDHDSKIRRHSIFVSPSFTYASSSAYAPPFVWNGKRFQVVLMLRIKPDAYSVSPSTLIDTPGDKNIPDTEMEWYTPRHGVLHLQRILVRCLGV